jgi:selenide,water dikinase
LDETMTSLLFDPQTSGGLLIAVAPDRATPLLAELKKSHPRAAVVGECVARRDVPIIVE